jgi:hypothetical protein
MYKKYIPYIFKKPYWKYLKIQEKINKVRWQKEKNPKRRSDFLFLTGNYRSGTTILFKTLSSSWSIDAYHDSTNKAFESQYLRSFFSLKRLLDDSFADYVLLKPNNEIFFAEKLLRQYPSSKILFIFRNYNQVINSVLKNQWQLDSNLQKLMNTSGKGIEEIIKFNLKYYFDNFDNEIQKEIERCLKKQHIINLIAIHWYLANLSYFDIHKTGRVFLINYNNFLSKPNAHFEFLSRKLNTPLDKESLKILEGNKSGFDFTENLSEGIRSRCDHLYENLMNEAISVK